MMSVFQVPRAIMFFYTPEMEKVLSSVNVTTYLKNVLGQEDPRLRRVTVMTIRSCYCTLMLKQYHEGELFKNVPLQEFVRLLAGVMNTSAEQIMNTYLTKQNDEKFRVMVSKVLNILRQDEF